eukprot:895369-Pyramimonas_sp.AAC.1
MGKSRKGTSTQTFYLSQFINGEVDEDDQHQGKGGSKKKGKDKRKPGGAGRHIEFAAPTSGSASKTSQQYALREAFPHLGHDIVDQVIEACNFNVDMAAEMLMSMSLAPSSGAGTSSHFTLLLMANLELSFNDRMLI